MHFRVFTIDSCQDVVVKTIRLPRQNKHQGPTRNKPHEASEHQVSSVNSIPTGCLKYTCTQKPRHQRQHCPTTAHFNLNQQLRSTRLLDTCHAYQTLGRETDTLTSFLAANLSQLPPC